MGIIHIDKVWDDILVALIKEVLSLEIKSIKLKVHEKCPKANILPALSASLVNKGLAMSCTA